MAEKLVKDITSMDEDFAKWYTDIVLKAELVDYSSVKGCVVFRPYGARKRIYAYVHFGESSSKGKRPC